MGSDKYDASYAKYIEHSMLKLTATRVDIKRICDEAMEYHFAAIAITPTHIKYAASLLNGSGVLVGAAIGFPLGTTTKFIKVAETTDAISNGAGEVDMIINLGALKEKMYETVLDEIKAVIEVAHPKIPVKVILETFLLTDEEKEIVCKMAMEADADYVKTCSGFNGGQATVEDIRLMKGVVGDRCKIKASTGINSREIVDRMLDAGAVRFGTSKGIQIVRGE
jgi:deoxyribose-phosphate aldolase